MAKVKITATSSNNLAENMSKCYTHWNDANTNINLFGFRFSCGSLLLCNQKFGKNIYAV